MLISTINNRNIDGSIHFCSQGDSTIIKVVDGEILFTIDQVKCNIQLISNDDSVEFFNELEFDCTCELLETNKPSLTFKLNGDAKGSININSIEFIFQNDPCNEENIFNEVY